LAVECVVQEESVSAAESKEAECGGRRTRTERTTRTWR